MEGCSSFYSHILVGERHLDRRCLIQRCIAQVLENMFLEDIAGKYQIPNLYLSVQI